MAGNSHGPDRLKRISNLAVPLVAAALATNLMTLVDTLMVGQLGNHALAGVGMGGHLFFLLLSIVLGLAAGVQAVVSRRVGEGRLAQTGETLNAGILLAIAIGTAAVALGYVVGPTVFGLMIGDEAVVKEGLAYLGTRLPSALIIGINIAFRSYWVGVSLARFSMISIIALSFSNVIFNYLLIFGHFGAPRLEVAGAGLGSTLATIVGLLINVAFAIRYAWANGFLQRLPETAQTLTILRLSIPESMRQVLFSVGVVLMYTLVGAIGSNELAAFHVVIVICGVAYLPHIGLGGASTTLVGEALGRRDVSDAKSWGWQVGNVSLVVLLLCGLPVLLFPGHVLALFLNDPVTLLLATLPLQLAVIAHALDGYSKVMGSALIGAGATRTSMALTLAPQWLFFLPVLAFVVNLGAGLDLAVLTFLASTVVGALLAVAIWSRERWRGIEI